MNAKMEISVQFLIELMHLPKDTKILSAGMNWFYDDFPTIVLTVNHPDIYKDNVRPMWRASYDENGNKKNIEFVEW